MNYATDSKIADLLAPSWFLSTDILNKRLEIAKRNNVSINSVTEEDAKKELKQENVHIMSFDTSFERVQKDIENIIPKLVKNSKVAANHNGDENTYFADKIKQNKEKILIGLAYLDRMYNFNIGNTNIKDIILDTPGYFGGTVDLLDWIISIGGSGGDTLKISNNKDAYINDTDDFKESIYNEKAQVKKYTVSFDKNATDATGTMAAQEFEHGKEQVLSKNQFERIGYDFIGWKDINGNIYTDQQMVNNLVAENDGQITLFAQWKPIEYQVKFHKNHSNAVGTMENQKMVYDQSYQLNKNEFTLDGYEFKGWATSPNGQVVYKDEEIVTKLTDKSNHIIDLYSIWEKKLI